MIDDEKEPLARLPLLAEHAPPVKNKM